jgi:hypothetical protein
MILLPLEFPSPITDERIPFLLPFDPQPEALPMPVVPVTVHDTVRYLSTPVLRMALAFNAGLIEKPPKRDDCAAFALACALGESVWKGLPAADRRLVRRRLDKSRLRCLDQGQKEPPTQAGESILITPWDIAPDDPKPGHHHMVRASVDGGKPLYASKIADNGLAVLHDFSTIVRCYPSDVAIVIKYRLPGSKPSRLLFGNGNSRGIMAGWIAKITGRPPRPSND